MAQATKPNPETTLPAAGPGSSYLHPHVCSLPVAVDIARNARGPVMVQVVTSRGLSRLGKLWPSGRFEVCP